MSALVSGFMLFVGMVAVLFFTTIAISTVRDRKRAVFLDKFQFPHGIRQRVQGKYPHLSSAQLDRVMDGLREYFHLCRESPRFLLAMPSQAVDAAWHEFILFTRNYQNFCDHALGRFLHHTPAEAMRSATEATEGIRRTWSAACKRAGIDAKHPTHLPALFALDTDLAIPNGFRYQLNCMQPAQRAADGTIIYCASDIGCGGGGGGSDGDGGGDGGGCGGGGGD